MLTLLKEITDLVQNGLPLTYQRKPGEIDERLIKEYFTDKKILKEISLLFNTESHISKLGEEHLKALRDLLKTHEKTFLSKNSDLAMQDLKIQNEANQVIKDSFEYDPNDIERLEQIGEFMSKIVQDVEEGAKEPMRGYLELKKIDAGCKNFLKLIADQAYSDFDNWDKNDLPYGFTGMVTNILYAKYDQDPIYAEKKEELKAREDLLKEAIKQDKKNRTINDADGCLVECPEYTYRASLVVKQGKVKRVGNTYITVPKKGAKK